jgi:hypothetical protein
MVAGVVVFGEQTEDGGSNSLIRSQALYLRRVDRCVFPVTNLQIHKPANTRIHKSAVSQLFAWQFLSGRKRSRVKCTWQRRYLPTPLRRVPMEPLRETADRHSSHIVTTMHCQARLCCAHTDIAIPSLLSDTVNLAPTFKTALDIMARSRPRLAKHLCQASSACQLQTIRSLKIPCSAE